MKSEAVAFSIRPYRESDFGAVAALWRKCGLTVPHNDPARDVGFCLASADAELFVGEEAGRLTAAVMTGHDGHRGWIYYLAVDPDSQGRGRGRRMVRHAEAWLGGRGAPKVNLMIRDGNETARDFYRAMGYQCEPRMVMARRLDGEKRKNAAAVPEGKIETVITYLEMTAPPATPPPPPPGVKLALLKADRPTASYYRYLYNTVGEPWLWYERRLLDDETLAGIIQSPDVDIFVLYVSGVPAGYGELEFRHKPDVELAYFGLMPEFIGRGLGGYFLRAMIDAAWSRKPRRLWVHTCTLDHPGALGAYQRAGFVAYRQATEIIADPRPIMEGRRS